MPKPTECPEIAAVCVRASQSDSRFHAASVYLQRLLPTFARHGQPAIRLAHDEHPDVIFDLQDRISRDFMNLPCCRPRNEEEPKRGNAYKNE
jgi:hypothetical protein